MINIGVERKNSKIYMKDCCVFMSCMQGFGGFMKMVVFIYIVNQYRSLFFILLNKVLYILSYYQLLSICLIDFGDIKELDIILLLVDMVYLKS